MNAQDDPQRGPAPEMSLVASALIQQLVCLVFMVFLLCHEGWYGLIALFASLAMIPMGIWTIIVAVPKLGSSRTRKKAVIAILIALVLGFPLTSLLLASGISTVVKTVGAAVVQIDVLGFMARVVPPEYLKEKPRIPAPALAPEVTPLPRARTREVPPAESFLSKLAARLSGLPALWQARSPKVVLNPASASGVGATREDLYVRLLWYFRNAPRRVMAVDGSMMLLDDGKVVVVSGAADAGFGKFIQEQVIDPGKPIRFCLAGHGDFMAAYGSFTVPEQFKARRDPAFAIIPVVVCVNGGVGRDAAALCAAREDVY